jgi:hypothetical protein
LGTTQAGVLDLVCDRGHDLDCAGAGADHGHASAAEIVFVVPTSGVEELAGEALEALDVGPGRIDETAGTGDDDPRAEGLAACGRERPEALGFVETGVDDLGVESQVVAQLPLVGDRSQIGLDLACFGEAAAPGRDLLEGERVGVRGDVAGRARIGVVTPGSADVASPFEDREGIDPRLLELDRGSDAGEARADDRDREIGSVEVVHEISVFIRPLRTKAM